MSELSAKFTPSEIEDKWYAHWEAKGYFHAEVDESKEPFSIVIPPPNVTGVLHMGHMLNNTIQDSLIRKARLDGKNACWIPGTDHASIATEAKVVRMLRERGIKKSDLTRDEFMAYAWEWKEEYGGKILKQLRKLGASCDWERTAFTMDEGYSKDVIHTFVDLYRKGKLYRDFRMVNWDCEAKTVLSNEEVIYGEEQAQLFYVKYFLEGSNTEGVVIATQRPETIMADTALAVNPKDPRYAHLKDKKVIVPLINRAIPVIFDEYVDIEFGTGALKVTPAHDPNDYELGKKHGLEVIDSLNDDGTLNEKCGITSLIGVDRFEARRHMKKLLTDAGNLEKLEDYKTNIGRSERTNSVVEPKMSLQWYVNMKAIAEPALTAVETDDIEFYPKSFKNVYRHWMENIRDWCISRQLWWGHRIPAYYYEGETYVAETVEEALAEAIAKTGKALTINDLRQDEDVLDTWASSWLWPISTFDGFKNSKEFNYFYPTSVLVTGWDIIFLWVARMAMAGFEWKNERPFKQVYFTGMVRDKQGRKMSKSLGNSPDALKLIEDYGADGVRFGVLSSSPAGGDLKFDDKLCEQGRNFSNKMWNALKLLHGWEINTEGPVSAKNDIAIKWFEHKMSSVITEVNSDFTQYRLSEGLMKLYNFIWDDFCSWYLEMIKPEYQQPIDKATLQATTNIFQKLMVMLHPFMPFVTEEIYNQLNQLEAEKLGRRGATKDCCAENYPKAKKVDETLVKNVEMAKDVITKIRDIRNAKGLKMKDLLMVKVVNTEGVEKLLAEQGLLEMIIKMANLESLETTSEEVKNAASFISGTDKFYVVLNQEINVEEERENITKKLIYEQGFLKSVDAKLSNERFVANAKPEIVAIEQQKRADALVRIRILEESLAGLGGMNTPSEKEAETPESNPDEPDPAVLKFISDLESDSIEKTESTTDIDKFSEAICAFANDFPHSKKAGHLLIGVKDNGTLSGLKATDELLKTIAQIRHNGQILPQPAMTVQKQSFEKGDVLIVKVEPSFLPPVRYKGKVWIRTGPTKAVANETEERILIEKRAANIQTYDVYPCIDTSIENDVSVVIIQNTYLPLAIDAVILEQNHRELKQQLSSLRLYDLSFGCVTNAGILLFGLNPNYYFPGAYIQYIKTDSIERDLDKVQSDKIFKGALFDVLREIDNFIKNNIIASRPVRIEGSFQDRQVYNYPYSALREFAMNAIMHRDYESNAPIYIYEFSDRIEIHNSGNLYGIAKQNFPNHNDYRNPVLAEAMRIMGYVNKFNYGIVDAQKKLKNNGNSPAIFETRYTSKFSVEIKINPEW
jgi:valyl-tRNA synthetase